MYDVRSTLDSDALEEKLSKRARGILDRELKPRKGAPAGTVKQRFLGAVTHRRADVPLGDSGVPVPADL